MRKSAREKALASTGVVKLPKNIAAAAAIAIDPNAGGGAGSSTTTGADNLDDAAPSFVAARTMVIEFVAACTRS